MAEESFKSKHLVLDKKANELFEQAFSKSEATTQKEAISLILATYLEGQKETDLTNYHNPIDVQEIEQLRAVKCDTINCELTKELKHFNSELSAVNEDLIAFNSELKAELNVSAEKLNANSNSMQNMDLANRLSPLQKIALALVAQNESAKRGKNVDDLQVLVDMFTAHVFKHQIQFFEKPNSAEVQRLYKEATNG